MILSFRNPCQKIFQGTGFFCDAGANSCWTTGWAQARVVTKKCRWWNGGGEIWINLVFSLCGWPFHLGNDDSTFGDSTCIYTFSKGDDGEMVKTPFPLFFCLSQWPHTTPTRWNCFGHSMAIVRKPVNTRMNIPPIPNFDHGNFLQVLVLEINLSQLSLTLGYWLGPIIFHDGDLLFVSLLFPKNWWFIRNW